MATYDEAFMQRVREGDMSTVEESRKIYGRDPGEHLMTHVMVLYSFRRDSTYAHELVHMSPLITARADMYLRAEDGSLEKLEPMATYLAWLSRHGKFTPSSQERLTNQAWAVVKKGIKLAEGHGGSTHTFCLLHLQAARLCFRLKKFTRFHEYQENAQMHVGNVSEPDQKARVYRGLAWNYFMARRPIRVLWYALKSQLVCGQTMFTRRKSLGLT